VSARSEKKGADIFKRSYAGRELRLELNTMSRQILVHLQDDVNKVALAQGQACFVIFNKSAVSTPYAGMAWLELSDRAAIEQVG
jgi:hypothetical protein